MSALYGAAFGIQGAVMRAAGNHVIQSSGAIITKRLQRRIWDIQPAGVHSWVVRPMQNHDEVNAAVDGPETAQKVAAVVYSTVESYRPKVPLIAMKWERMRNWAWTEEAWRKHEAESTCA